MNYDEFLAADGSWLQLVRNVAGDQHRPALFLDRDGVLVEDLPYLHRVADVVVTEGAGAALAAANRAGWFVIIVTNQSGVGRGIYGWPDFAAVQAALLERLHRDGAAVDMVLACPHHADALPPFRQAEHPWRKPHPGMILAAAERLPIQLAQSWIVGDRALDLAAGRAAGLAGGLHLLTGQGRAERSAALALATGEFRVRIGTDISAATMLLEGVG